MYRINGIEFETKEAVDAFLLTATEVDASYCTSLTKLSAPMATYVYAYGCTSLTELSAPKATEVYADGCTSLTNCNGYSQLSAEDCASNLKKVAELALASEGALEMDAIHACETTHCIAGWAVTNYPNGAEMEKKCGWWLAGKFLLGDEAAGHFHDNQSDGLKYLKSINKE